MRGKHLLMVQGELFNLVRTLQQVCSKGLSIRRDYAEQWQLITRLDHAEETNFVSNMRQLSASLAGFVVDLYGMQG